VSCVLLLLLLKLIFIYLANFCNNLKKILLYTKRDAPLSSRRNLRQSSAELTSSTIQNLQAKIQLTEDSDNGTDHQLTDPSSQLSSKSHDSFKFNPEKNQISNLADLFLHYAPAFKLYVGFISKYGQSIETLGKEQDRPNKKLNTFLDEQLNVLIERGENGTVHDYLVTMIQRIPRYRMLLEDIIKHIETDHEAYERLGQALKNISETAKFCNDKDREYATAYQMFALQKKIQLKPEHRNPGRRLIEQFNSEDTKVQVMKKGKQEVGGKIDFYIFNDSIVFEKKYGGVSAVNLNSLLKKSKTSIQYIRLRTDTPYGTVTNVDISKDDRYFKVVTTYLTETAITVEKEFGFVCEDAQTCSHIVDVIEQSKTRK
jgi:hypothetical protein